MPKETYALYHFSTCLFCLKVRTFLWFKGLKIPTRNIVNNQRNLQDLVEGGGKQQVPCLRIERSDGSVEWLYESSDIIRYINVNMAH